MAQILFYIKDKNKESKIRTVSESLGIDTKRILSDQLNCTLGELAGMPTPSGSKKTNIPLLYQQPDLLVFHGLSDQQLNQFLSDYRKNQIEVTPMKAVITMYNISWSVYELTQELMKEEAAIRNMKK